MSFSLCLCGRESWLLSCCRIVAIVPCDFLIVSLQKKERAGFFLAVVWSPLFRVFFSLCLCRRKREMASFLLSYSRHCSVCLSHYVFAEERERWLLSCCRIVAIVPCAFLVVSLRKRKLASFLLSYSRHCSV